MTDSKKSLSFFGEHIAKDVRDRAIEGSLTLVRCKGSSATENRYRNRLKKLSGVERKLIEDLCIEVVDETIHYFLWWLECEEERVKIEVNLGGNYSKPLNDISDGLAGEYPNKDGWAGLFSKYPYPQ